MQIKEYRESPKEKARIQELMRIIPKNRSTVLEIGARDGHISKLLTSLFVQVTALDLKKPEFSIPRVTPVQGDVSKLKMPDDSYDVVICTEVLEHVAEELLDDACREIIRVAKYDIVIGVPYKQDLRVGRTTCGCCGWPNPPWGHVNSFDEERLERLFQAVCLVSKNYIGETRDKTNALSAFLMNAAGNPSGTYDQEEACIHCGERLVRAPKDRIVQRLYSKLASILTRIQRKLIRSSPNWIHMTFMKRPFVKIADE